MTNTKTNSFHPQYLIIRANFKHGELTTKFQRYFTDMLLNQFRWSGPSELKGSPRFYKHHIKIAWERLNETQALITVFVSKLIQPTCYSLAFWLTSASIAYCFALSIPKYTPGNNVSLILSNLTTLSEGATEL